MQDLRRCAMDSASAVFIFANKFAANTDGEDSRTILRALSIKRWVVGPLLCSVPSRSPSTPSCFHCKLFAPPPLHTPLIDMQARLPAHRPRHEGL